MKKHSLRVQCCTIARTAIDDRTIKLDCDVDNTSATFERHLGVPFINKWTPYKELLCKFSWIQIE